MAANVMQSGKVIMDQRLESDQDQHFNYL